MKFIVITGMSGAGKSRALATFEDLGFYCVDNMPISLIPKFAELAVATRGKYENVALVTDIRAGEGVSEIVSVLDQILTGDITYKIIFLEASNNKLINRFKETRRKHPLCAGGKSITDAIYSEREKLEPVRRLADYIIDTTTMSVSKLREYLLNLFLNTENGAPIAVTVMSFGFKYGVPPESDLVFDVRFLPNPYYETELRSRTGLEADVSRYVFKSGEADVLLKKLEDLFDFLVPRYISEGKNSLVVSIGCTGGKHRSVAIAEAVAAYFKRNKHFTTVNHRDIERKKA